MSDGTGSVAVASEDKTLPIVTYALFLLSLVSGGLTGLIGLVLAYVNRSTASPAVASHYTFLIRTFWIGLAAIIAGASLMFWGAIFSLILIGIPFLMLGKLILGLLGIWFAVRCVVGLVRLTRDEAYPTPMSWVL